MRTDTYDRRMLHTGSDASYGLALHRIQRDFMNELLDALKESLASMSGYLAEPPLFGSGVALPEFATLDKPSMWRRGIAKPVKHGYVFDGEIAAHTALPSTKIKVVATFSPEAIEVDLHFDGGTVRESFHTADLPTQMASSLGSKWMGIVRRGNR